MPIKHPGLQLTHVAGAASVWHARICTDDLLTICHEVRDGGGRLLSLWGSDERAHSNGHGKDGDSRHAHSPLSNPDETASHSTKASSEELLAGHPKDDAQVAGYLPQAGRAQRGGRSRANESLREFQINGFALHVALVNESGIICLSLPLPEDQPVYPDISAIFPAACRMQRAAYDLLGIAALGYHRKWLRHAAWSYDSFPLRKDFADPPPCRGRVREGVETGSYPPPNLPLARGEECADAYPFVQVEGQGVHEIAVGPVHAGIIEPGHFRFSVVGEKVLRLEERFGYTHKGVEKRFESMNLQQGAKLAGRVSGDSTVAYAWAYSMAAESIAAITPPDRALWLRALFLERERIANHLGDLGYLGSDVAFSFGFAQFWILKEQVLRHNAALFGHRYLMDVIVPGGVSVDLAESDKQMLLAECDMLEREVHILRSLYEEHAGVQDRYIGAGRVEPKLASKLGLCGQAGRASSQAWDARVQFPCAPYDKLDVHMATHRNGDVAARVIVRFDELFESIRLQRKIMVNLIGRKELAHPLTHLPGNGFGIGMVEGWRGEVMVAIHTDGEGNLARVHPHDPSWQNWPVLEHAILGNIVPDFPLINKSFNLSYSGCDL